MTLPPSGTVTFLYADVEGGPRRWERESESVRVAIARQLRLLRESVERHTGYVFRLTGNAVYAAFDTAAHGFAAVIASQRDLVDAARRDSSVLHIRMALHTGAADEQDGEYSGPAINRVARLLVTGHSGQMLLSQPTFDLVRADLPSGVTLRDLGLHRLGDLTRPERVYQLVIDGVPADFPPLLTLDTRPNNLPIQSTRMIGRERELADVRALLLRPDVRLLTLAGPGGTGKTRLSIQVAADVVEEYRDGVYFVALSQVGDASIIASTIAKTLGVPEVAERPPWEGVREHLRERHTLLLLDNFEHLMPAASLVADLLTIAPRLNLLVTSRAILRVYGEHTYPVPPLSLPDVGSPLPPLDRLGQYESVRLFAERTQAVKPDFLVTLENAPAVAEICQRLDGLPLAIELAAARSRLLPPQALLSRLANPRGDSLRLLTGGARDRPLRQQTLRDAIAWSYDLLEPPEQALFRRLGVFLGGCSLDTIEAVASSKFEVRSSTFEEEQLTSDVQLQTSNFEPPPNTQHPTPNTLDLVASLVDKSLVRQEEVDGEPRFRMLETIREFALERLAADGELVEVRRRHAACFLAFAEQAEPLLRGAGQGAWLRRLSLEHDNLRSALAWSAARSDEAETHLRLAFNLAWFWYVAGHFEEGWRWLSSAAQRRDIVSPAVRAPLLARAGVMAFLLGDHTTARVHLSDSVVLARDLDDSSSIAYALLWLGNLDRAHGQDEDAIAKLEESLSRFQALADDWGMGWALDNLALHYRAHREHARALGYLENGLAAFRRIGDTWGVAWSLGHLAVALRDAGELVTAARHQEEGLALFRELGDAWGTGWALYNLGTITAGLGDYAAAVGLFEESIERRRRLGDRRGSARSLQALGNARQARGDLAAAANHYRECARLRLAQGDRTGLTGQAEALEGLASIAVVQRAGVRAARLLGAAESLRVASRRPLPSADRQTYERTLAAAEALLGPDALEQELNVGRALTAEAALALAINDDG
jgi:predicted ATPase